MVGVRNVRSVSSRNIAKNRKSTRFVVNNAQREVSFLPSCQCIHQHPSFGAAAPDLRNPVTRRPITTSDIGIFIRVLHLFFSLLEDNLLR